MNRIYIRLLLPVLFCSMPAWAEEAAPLLTIEPAADGGGRSANVPAYVAVETDREIAIDGDLAEWEGVEAIVLDAPYLESGRMLETVDYPWGGPEDLSARAYLLWDADNLYFACDVTDDVMQRPPEVVWSGDAIQMIFDPLNDDIRAWGGRGTGALIASGPDDSDLIIGPSGKGAGAIRNWGPKGKSWRGRVEAIVVAVEEKADGSGYWYEAAIPWAELYPFRPLAREVCGFGFVLADDDGEGFKWGLEWTKGIWHGKDASALGNLILQAAPVEGGRRFLGSTGERWADDGEAVLAYLGIDSPVDGTTLVEVRVEREGETVAELSREVPLEPGANRFKVVWNVGQVASGWYRFAIRVDGEESVVEVRKYSSSSPTPEVDLSFHRNELVEMAIKDQRYRGRIASLDKLKSLSGSDADTLQSLWGKQTPLDSSILTRLEQIIEQYGWPTLSAVGQAGSSSAWMIIQHADLPVQEKYFPLMLEQAERGELLWRNLALTVDRIRVRKGEPQVYGSHPRRNPDTMEWEVYPIEDEMNVNKRRKEVGLGPLEEYLAQWDIIYVPKTQGP